MPGDANLALVERFYHEMWDQFDTSLFPELLTEDFRFRGSLGTSTNGWEEFGHYVRDQGSDGSLLRQP